MNIINLPTNLKKAAAGTNTPHPILLFEAAREIERLQSKVTEFKITQELQADILQLAHKYGRLAL